MKVRCMCNYKNLGFSKGEILDVESLEIFGKTAMMVRSNSTGNYHVFKGLDFYKLHFVEIKPGDMEVRCIKDLETASGLSFIAGELYEARVRSNYGSGVSVKGKTNGHWITLSSREVHDMFFSENVEEDYLIEKLRKEVDVESKKINESFKNLGRIRGKLEKLEQNRQGW